VGVKYKRAEVGLAVHIASVLKLEMQIGRHEDANECCATSWLEIKSQLNCSISFVADNLLWLDILDRINTVVQEDPGIEDVFFFTAFMNEVEFLPI
jgi:hypothetical protein